MIQRQLQFGHFGNWGPNCSLRKAAIDQQWISHESTGTSLVSRNQLRESGESQVTWEDGLVGVPAWLDLARWKKYDTSHVEVERFPQLLAT